ncbi:MAG: class I SAM-dependent methyltransferase [archaeon]
MRDLSIVQLWERCLDRIYPGEQKVRYTDAIGDLLKKEGSVKIRDASCGTGELALGLQRRGIAVSCSDSSRLMLEQFKTRAGPMAQAERLPWSDLGEKYEAEFDALLVLRNSLPYVISWGKPSVNPEAARQNIRTAMRNFYKALKPGGFLLVDTHLKNDEHRELGEVDVDGEKEQWTLIRNIDKRKKIMNWGFHRKHAETGETRQNIYQGYPIDAEELTWMLQNVGFKWPEAVRIPGENNYQVFLARKGRI